MMRYEADASVLIQRWFGKEKLDKDVLFHKMMMQQLTVAAHPEGLETVQKAIGHPEYTREQMQHIVRGATTQMIIEAATIIAGTTIYVEDRGLIEAMLRTDIDAIMADVRMPFPLCEFVFPPDIPLGVADYTLSGAILADGKWSLKHVWKRMPSEWDVNALGLMTFLSRMVRGGKRDPGGVSWMRFRQDTPLDTLPIRVPESAEEMEARHALVKLCFGMCLYLQTQEGQKALEPHASHEHVQGMSPAEGRVRKARKGYRIRDLITHTLREPGIPTGGHHASPRPHWRKLHMRSLRAERFKRNPDGSVRVVWVRATLVREHDGIDHAERKVANAQGA